MAAPASNTCLPCRGTDRQDMRHLNHPIVGYDRTRLNYQLPLYAKKHHVNSPTEKGLKKSPAHLYVTSLGGEKKLQDTKRTKFLHDSCTEAAEAGRSGTQMMAFSKWLCPQRHTETEPQKRQAWRTSTQEMSQRHTHEGAVRFLVPQVIPLEQPGFQGDHMPPRHL